MTWFKALMFCCFMSMVMLTLILIVNDKVAKLQLEVTQLKVFVKPDEKEIAKQCTAWWFGHGADKAMEVKRSICGRIKS